MGRYLSKRLVSLSTTLLFMSLVVFFMVRLMPGDVVDIMLGQETAASEEILATLRRQYGLDQPLYVQYIRWMSHILRGDLGLAMRTRMPIRKDMLRKLPITIELAILSVSLSVIIAIPLGILSALKSNSVTDLLSRFVGIIGLSFPNFWLAIVLILIASRGFSWLPPPMFVSFFENPLQNLAQMAMPAFTLGFRMVASVMRMTRSTMLEVMGQDYVQVARAKGLAERHIIARHALKNASIPIITLIGINLGYLLSGTVIVEQIFGLPGLGWMLVNAIHQRDYTTLQAAVLASCLFFALTNLLVDILYAYLDPRIRHT
jgi:peptide/nickel transport system permease protein